MPTAVELTGGKSLHFEVMAILQRLSGLYGKALHITEIDREWIRFYVDRVSDAALIRELDHKQNLVFGSCQGRFQFLCPEVCDGKRGIFLHHLYSPALQQEYLPGCWFY